MQNHTIGMTGDILHVDGSSQPSRHSSARAVHMNPTRHDREFSSESRNHLHPTAQLIHHLSILLRLQPDVRFRTRFQQHTSMRRSTCHRQVAKRSPYFVPCHATVAPILQASGSHGNRSYVFIGVLVLLRKKGPEPCLKNL